MPGCCLSFEQLILCLLFLLLIGALSCKVVDDVKLQTLQGGFRVCVMISYTSLAMRTH